MPRIRPIRTEAIVLRQRPLGDADRICVLFSPTRGRVEAVAKGVRKPLSKMSGHVEPLSRGQFGLAQGRSLYVITDAQTLDPLVSVARRRGTDDGGAGDGRTGRSLDGRRRVLRSALPVAATVPGSARPDLIPGGGSALVHFAISRSTGIPARARRLRSMPSRGRTRRQRLLPGGRRRHLPELSRSGTRTASVLSGLSIVTLYETVVG